VKYLGPDRASQLLDAYRERRKVTAPPE
jgi:hypothetical protein